jgi:hypothetical protein
MLRLDLSLEQRGALCTVVNLIFIHDGACPDNDRYIAGNLNVHPNKWRAVKQQLIELDCLYLDGDGNIRNKDCDAEIQRMVHYAEQQAASGAKGGFKSAIRRYRPEQPYRPYAGPHGGPRPPTVPPSQPPSLPSQGFEKFPSKINGANQASLKPRRDVDIREEKEEAAPPSSFGNAVVAAQEVSKGSGERSEPIPPASDHLARLLKERRWAS